MTLQAHEVGMANKRKAVLLSLLLLLLLCMSTADVLCNGALLSN